MAKSKKPLAKHSSASPSGAVAAEDSVVQSILARPTQAKVAPDLLAAFRKETPFVWNEVAPVARSFACALVVRHARRSLCFICPDARTQESLGDELRTWAAGGVIFPELTMAVVEDALPDPETTAERLDILYQLENEKKPPWILISAHQLEESMPPRKSAKERLLSIACGEGEGPEVVREVLIEWGYELVGKVYQRGQFAQRGGILDVYSWHRSLPVRIEFFDTMVDSIREFDPDAQTSVRRIENTEILAPSLSEERVPLRTWLADFQWIYVEPVMELPADACIIRSALDPDFPSPLALEECTEAAFSAGDFLMNEIRRKNFFAQLETWLQAEWMVSLFCDNEGEWERFGELARDHGVDPSRLLPCEGNQGSSFLCPSIRCAVLTDSDLFGRSISRRIRRLAHRRESLFAGRAVEDVSQFEEGDFVVHLEHGIGRYLGLQKLDEQGDDVLALEFANESRLYVPIEQAWQLSRYIGLGKKRPDLSDLGSEKWDKAKSKTRDAIFIYAKQMLRLQAERETALGHAFPVDSHWQQEFEDAFPFQETPDQARAIQAAKEDMESEQPMDRLICGDVGFGKTEVAIRAAFKAVMGGKQVAFLAPTTVLAQQHFETLRERMSEYPIRIEILSRYRTQGEQNATVQALGRGDVDILVGTHRLTSPDVCWKNLGLLIVDEEQRFGVKQKDLLKQRFRLVDVLTLSATPIPRTLYMALMGARDMSVIETPPLNRQPVETLICGYDERIIRDAVQREIARGGQVYLLHNRIATIERLAAKVRDLVPAARVEVGHGQMAQGELEDVMSRFVAGQTDVLVSTTIIESGLDIPNANTIIIDRADMFGLADLYQLRGRVGRSGVKAYAYLLIPRSLLTVGEARKRMSAIKQYSQLGAGFKIAMRDLEIRGAGNILGTAQSGHIITIGFDLYCKMLRAAVKKLHGDDSGTRRLCGLRLDFLQMTEGEFILQAKQGIPAFIPTAYIAESQMRIEGYRKFSEADSLAMLQQLEEEWRDRFGPLPIAVKNLLVTGEIKIAGGERQLTLVEVKEDKLMITKRGDYILLGNKFPRLRNQDAQKKLAEVLVAVKKL